MHAHWGVVWQQRGRLMAVAAAAVAVAACVWAGDYVSVAIAADVPRRHKVARTRWNEAAHGGTRWHRASQRRAG